MDADTCTTKAQTGITDPSSGGVAQKEMHLPNTYFQVLLGEIVWSSVLLIWSWKD